MTNQLATSNRAQLSYIQETSWGVVPTTGDGKFLRMTGETLDYTLTKQSDKEIRSDRQIVSSTTVGAAAQGDIKTHMQYAEYDPLFLSLLQTTDAASVYGVNGVSTTFVSTITTTTITAGAAPTGPSAFTNLQPGQWFVLNAPSDPNNGTYFRVSTVTPPTGTVITLDTSTPAVAGGVAGSSIGAYRMTNGTTMTSFSIERSVNDIAVPLYFCYQGMQPSKFACSFASGSLTEPTFSFMGKNVIPPTTVKNVPGTIVASQTYTIQNAVKGVGFVWEGGAPITGTFIKKLDLSIDNQLRQQDAVGNLGAVGLGDGSFKCSGTFDMYLANGSLYTKFLTDTFTSISVSTKDTAGNGYVFTFPRIMLTKSTITAGSVNTDMMISCSFDALADTTNAVAALQKTLFIDRLGAAVVPGFA